MARTGKIARLPEAVREELNKRIRGGQLGPQILPWLNGLPEVRAVLDEFFGGQDVSAQNLSDWRSGGYAEWEEKQDRHYQRLERIRELSAMSLKLAEANGGNLTEGAASILGGNILEVLEQIDAWREDGKEQMADGQGAEKLKAMAEAIDNLTNSVARLRRGDHDKELLRQNELKLQQKDRELALAAEKFQRETCELFIQWAQDRRALELASAPLSNEAKIDELGKLMFQELWAKAKAQQAQAAQQSAHRADTTTGA